jgi:hypothetical protein
MILFCLQCASGSFRTLPSTVLYIQCVQKAVTFNADPFPNIRKAYIPSASDSPLFRLITILHPSEESQRTEQSQDLRQLLESRRLAAENNSGALISDMASRQFRSESSPQLMSFESIFHRAEPRLTQSCISLTIDESSESKDTFDKSNSWPSLPAVTSIDSLNELNRKIEWTKEYEHIDIDWSMQAMDVLYNASFYEYIRDEKNLELSSIRLAKVIKDYKPRQVAEALMWIIQGWTVESTSKLLRSIFADWLPDLAGCVFQMISENWPRRPQQSLCIAYLLLSEPASSAASFIRSLTHSWDKKDKIDLISYLDNILEVP